MTAVAVSDIQAALDLTGMGAQIIHANYMGDSTSMYELYVEGNAAKAGRAFFVTVTSSSSAGAIATAILAALTP